MTITSAAPAVRASGRPAAGHPVPGFVAADRGSWSCWPPRTISTSPSSLTNAPTNRSDALTSKTESVCSAQQQDQVGPWQPDRARHYLYRPWSWNPLLPATRGRI